MQPLVIFGAGGFAREVAQLVDDLNAHRPTWRLLGFLSDDPSDHGATVGGRQILGGRTWLQTQTSPVAVALGVGNPAVRRRLVAVLRDHAVSFPSLRHPSVISGARVSLGDGVILCAGSVLTVDIVVHDFAAINLACTVGHDAVVGAYATVAPGVLISGNVTIGEGADIGTGSRIIQGVHVGPWSIVGAGAVVSRAIPANTTAVGVPARPIKERPEGWHLEPAP